MWGPGLQPGRWLSTAETSYKEEELGSWHPEGILSAWWVREVGLWGGRAGSCCVVQKVASQQRGKHSGEDLSLGYITAQSYREC